MRHAKFALAALFAVLGIGPSNAGPDDEALRKFGMLGRLAVDCTAPAGPNNPHLIYAVSPQGKLTRTLKMTPELDGTFPMRNVRLLTPGLMQHEETGRQSEMTITVARIAGKFRSWHSIRRDGTVLIAEGKFPKSGAPTLAFEKCRN